MESSAASCFPNLDRPRLKFKLIKYYLWVKFQIIFWKWQNEKLWDLSISLILRLRNRLGGVLDSFSLFSEINFFQIFRHDFSRFLHIWPIFRVGENGKNLKNLDHEEPDPRSEFRAWERFIEALSGKKGFLFMTLMKKIFDHLRLDMVKKIVNRPRRGRWTKKSGDLKEENSFCKLSFVVRLAY